MVMEMMKMVEYIKRGIRGIWFYVWGHIFALFLYDKKYIKGRWFSGKLHGICALGWEWVVYDAIGKIGNSINKGAKFPISKQCHVIYPENIIFHPDDLNNFHSFGIYYQAIEKIIIGHGTYIGPNVGLISSNHNPKNLDEHIQASPLVIGENCWIGMNSVLLPGVQLGDNTVVGAGSVVTKSFEEGFCVIAGNPAKKIRDLKE